MLLLVVFVSTFGNPCVVLPMIFLSVINDLEEKNDESANNHVNMSLTGQEKPSEEHFSTIDHLQGLVLGWLLASAASF